MSDIQPNVIYYSYVMRNRRGKVLDSSGNQFFVYIESKAQVFPAIEGALRHLNIGDSQTLSLSASEAYGEYKDSLLLELPKTRFSTDPELDSWVPVETSTGGNTKLRVVDFTDETVILDGNHPFAGLDLTFDIKVEDRRSATPTEIESGQVADLRTPETPQETTISN